MPPFQFDDFALPSLSTSLAGAPLRGEGGKAGGAPLAGQAKDRASMGGRHLEHSNPEQAQTETRVFAALAGSADLLAYLAQSGMRVEPLASPHDAIARAAELKGNVLLLDWDYPGIDPYEVCRALGLDQRPHPVIVLSAQDDGFDEVMAFEFGASDFLVKPVQPRVLLARIKSSLRGMAGRSRLEAKEHRLVFGRLALDLSSRTAAVGGQPVELSSAEFELLAYLAARAGRVVRRDEILRALCKDTVRTETRSIDSRMYRLRKRFAPYCDAQAKIKSIRPQGYLFCDEDW
ncbi:MAG: response regulator transcription factor [Betaproteobacteria bacterium]|nr:response regulator transcription factor [Betaproteobacteria bacterium]